nr:unnamed protein product [Callosobruchus chinensis]CAH7752315.1 unnamed protein product [Callosobruchus chinensis]CAH7768983.1 unnamed protein product [Callosobruchus chinensis]
MLPEVLFETMIKITIFHLMHEFSVPGIFQISLWFLFCYSLGSYKTLILYDLRIFERLIEF